MTGEELSKKLELSPMLAGCGLNPEQVRERAFPAGQILSDCPNGEPSVGLILSGRVEVYSVAPDGKDVQLNVLKAGECFGICNLLDGAELQTVLRCAENVRLLYIPKAALLSLIKSDADLALRYAALCNQKLRFLIQRIELLTMQSCRGRIIAYLLAHRDEDGCVKNFGSREELASRLGVSRAALFRELAALQSAGAIEAKGGNIRVINQLKLEEILYHPSEK